MISWQYMVSPNLPVHGLDAQSRMEEILVLSLPAVALHIPASMSNPLQTFFRQPLHLLADLSIHFTITQASSSASHRGGMHVSAVQEDTYVTSETTSSKHRLTTA